MPKSALMAAAWLAGVSTFATDAAAADCVGVFKFIPNDRLSIQEYSRISDTISREGANSTVLVASPTNYEDTAGRGTWDLWGVIYGGSVDLGERVVGGTLWVKNREVFGTSGGGDFKIGKDGVRLTIRPAQPIKGCKAGFTFRLDPKGRLFANGALVGRAKDVSEK
jgi:hypothetical protein